MAWLAPSTQDPTHRPRDGAALAAVVLLASLVTVWWSWPGIQRWDTTIAYTEVDGGMGTLQRADFYLNAWTLTWVSHALATAPTSLFDGNTFHPARLSVAYSESMLGYVPLFAPVYWLTRNPVLALNVMTALTYPLAAAGAFLLARLWLGVPAAAVVALLFAFTPARYVTPPHYQCLGIAGLPLIVLAVERWLRHARVRSLVLLVAAIVWQSTCSAYLLYAVLILLLCWLPASLWHHRARLDRRRLLGLATSGALAAVVVGTLMWPYVVLRSQGLMTTYDDDRTALGLVPVLARESLRTFLLEKALSPVGWLLAGLGTLVAARDGRRWAKRGALLLVLVGCVAALGPRLAIGDGEPLWSPYLVLRDWIPGFATVRMPLRFVVIAQLGLVLLAGLGVERVLAVARPRARTSLAAALAVLALATMLLPPLPVHALREGRHAPAAYAWLAAHGDGRALIEVPPPADTAERSRRTFLSTTHWHPVVEGYAANGPKHVGMISWISRGLPGDGALQQIVDLVDVGWLIVHRDEMDVRTSELWDGDLPAGLEQVAAFGPDVVYRVTRAPRDDRRARLVNAATTLGGTPIAAVGARCSGTLAFDHWPKVPVEGESLHAEVVVINTSRETWPANGFLPAGLVALEASVRRASGAIVRTPFRIRLDDDLAPDTPQNVAVWIVAPLPPGDYVLHLRLLQPVRGPLDDCVPPLEVPFSVEPKARTVLRMVATD